MNPQYIVQGIFVVTGIVAVLAAALNWDWFFNAQNAQLIVRNVGRNRARLFYGILGAILISMAIFFYYQTRSTSSLTVIPAATSLACAY
ncbi:immunity 17 family protein [uncultured Bacteroides sp.]|uniref:immunity 17 family protein n=1 Tax=uncultured Bacteroides sp. TaxID=162156 RepID=UPI002AA7D6C2|nr:immunity 17 family protein [uncultured Bacteroides sp.]